MAADLASRLDLAARPARASERARCSASRACRCVDGFTCSRKVEKRPMTLRSLSDLRDAREFVERHAGFARAARPRVVADFVHGEFALERLEHAPIERRSARRCSCRGPLPARRSCCRAPSRGGARGRRRARTAASPASRDTPRRRSRAASRSQCFAIEKPCGTLSVVHSRYAEPGVSASVERITTCPENGSSFHRKSNAASSLSVGSATRRARPARGSSPSASGECGGSCRRRASRGGVRAPWRRRGRRGARSRRTDRSENPRCDPPTRRGCAR